MLKPSIPQLVFNTLYPRPSSSSPGSFAAHIVRNLVPEVRKETQNFYGDLGCIESQYPGLDYSYLPHRKRLSRFDYHRRLFRAFDALGLTEYEIASLCVWEGTKSAKDRYERDQGVAIRDTTTDTTSIDPPHIPPSVHIHYLEESLDAESHRFTIPLPRRSSVDNELGGESSDDGMESYGTRLNERLLEVTAAREQGTEATSEELELFQQWLKEAVERGDGYSDLMDAIREGRPIHRDTSVFLPELYSPPSIPAHPSTARPIHSAMSEGALMSGFIPMTPPEPSIGSPRNPARTAR